MHLEARGTFQTLTHDGETYVVMNVEGTRLYITSHAQTASNSTTVLSPLGNFNTMSKVRAAIAKHSEKR
jgi:hypothetical protein